jgi:hypothetical protein
MKLTLESYSKKYSIETDNDDLNIEEYTEIIVNLLISAGFARETIIECFNEME